MRLLSFYYLTLLSALAAFVLLPLWESSFAADRRTPVVVAVEKVGPAVVNINTSIRMVRNPFRARNPLRDFFGRPYEGRAVERESLGSGVIIRPDGYILTNNHVIAGATQIKVTLADQREFPAEVVGADPRSDLAIIKVNPKSPLPVAAIGKSDNLMIGETVIAIGNPFGLSHTVTTGIVSAVGRDIKAGDGKIYQDFIQLDASINPGNSGGPLLNINGELIGVNTAIHQAAEGIGFAIPIDRAMKIVADLIDYGEVHRGYIGFFVEDLSPRLAARLGWTRPGGALVIKVMGGGPATVAGIKPGDIIYKVEGKPVKGRRDFESHVSSFKGGEKIAFGLFRDGADLSISLVASEITGEVADRIAAEWLGIEVRQIDPNARRRYRLPVSKGVVIVKVNPRSELASIGVEPGDVIRRVNRTNVDTQDDYRKAIVEGRHFGSAIVYVQRGQQIYQIAVGG